ncbi:MAG: PTS sugar transporter subunit IIA, partial [Holophagales bacterium]|nr:PTS sugar transporter subunit IIA [Holophagales bacterium]
ELRGILKEKGLRDEDPFDEIVARGSVIDLAGDIGFDELTEKASTLLAAQTGLDADLLAEELLQGTRIGATPVSQGVALPHVRSPNLSRAEMVIVRSKKGVEIVPDLPGPGSPPDADGRRAHAIFFLVSPKEDPAQHLRILAQLADHVEQDHFTEQWFAARDDHDLKEILLRDENFLTFTLGRDGKGKELIGKAVKDIDLPADALLAIVRRRGETLVPKGGTVLEKDDHLTIIGTQEAIQQLDRWSHD